MLFAAEHGSLNLACGEFAYVFSNISISTDYFFTLFKCLPFPSMCQ